MLKMLVNLAGAAALFAAAAPAAAQIQEVDPSAPTSWNNPPAPNATPPAPDRAAPFTPRGDDGAAPADETSGAEPSSPREWTPTSDNARNNEGARVPTADRAIPQDYAAPSHTGMAPPGTAVPRRDVFTAAEGVFGRGARGLAGILEDILRDQGEPIGYIAGQEASGAFVFGVRYGSGVLHHSIEGDRNVYWTGPSVGFDVGGDINKVFVLVYNLQDSQQLFRRYPGAEGHMYFVGGFSATYLRRGDVVLIPVRLGGGVRLGANVGYMRFSERNRWLPF